VASNPCPREDLLRCGKRDTTEVELGHEVFLNQWSKQLLQAVNPKSDQVLSPNALADKRDVDDFWKRQVHCRQFWTTVEVEPSDDAEQSSETSAQFGEDDSDRPNIVDIPAWRKGCHTICLCLRTVDVPGRDGSPFYVQGTQTPRNPDKARMIGTYAQRFSCSCPRRAGEEQTLKPREFAIPKESGKDENCQPKTRLEEMMAAMGVNIDKYHEVTWFPCEHVQFVAVVEAIEAWRQIMEDTGPLFFLDELLIRASTWYGGSQPADEDPETELPAYDAMLSCVANPL